MGITIQKHASLKNYNTFGVDVKAGSLAIVKDQHELVDVLRNADTDPWVLGGGSNVLLTKDVENLVLKIEIGGIEIEEELPHSVLIKVGAGVIWHDLVIWAVRNGFGGIENLALIPGRVGAAPIQNIGAYGVELNSIFHHLEAVELRTSEHWTFDTANCQFGYRDSFFKNSGKGKFCITHVVLKLNKTPHSINADYGAIQGTLTQKGIIKPSINDVFEAVIEIRSDKLPDPAVLGNSGSFFKNPVVSKEVLDGLLRTHQNLVYYAGSDDKYKIPAGWLIEQCGLKGKRNGNVGCFEKQALVIVNYGGASGQEILDHSIHVQQMVNDKFGILLSPEVNVI